MVLAAWADCSEPRGSAGPSLEVRLGVSPRGGPPPQRAQRPVPPSAGQARLHDARGGGARRPFPPFSLLSQGPARRPEAPLCRNASPTAPRNRSGLCLGHRAQSFEEPIVNSVTTRKCEQMGLRFCHGEALQSCALRPQRAGRAHVSLRAGAAPRAPPSAGGQRGGSSLTLRPDEVLQRFVLMKT